MNTKLNISKAHKIALGSGFIAISFANNGISALATPYFQMTLGLDPFLLNFAIALPMIFAALISRKVGQISDDANAIQGVRKNGILFSGWAAGLFFSLLWMVPTEWSDTQILLYILFANLCFYISTTFLTINIKSFSFEVSTDSVQRVLVMSYVSLFERAGSIFYFWLFPFAQLTLWGSLQSGIKHTGLLIGLVLIALLSSICAYFCQSKSKQTNHVSYIKSSSRKFNTSDKRIHRALILLLCLTAIKIGAIGTFTSFDFYLLVYHVSDGSIAAGAYWKGILSSSFAILGLLFIPIVSYFTLKFGKLAVLKVIYLLTAAGSIAKWYIYQPGNEWWVILDALLGAPSWIAISVIIPSMLAELSALEHKSSGVNKVGYFIAAQNKVISLSFVAVMLGSGLLLNVIGFDAHLPYQQSESTIYIMKLLLTTGPLLLSLTSIWILTIYPFKEDKLINLQVNNS